MRWTSFQIGGTGSLVAWVAGFCEYTKLFIKMMYNAFAPVQSQKNPGEKKIEKKVKKNEKK